MKETTKKYIQQIVDEGFCVIPNVYAPEDVRRALDTVTYWNAKFENGDSDDSSYLVDKKDLWVWNLQNKDYDLIQFLLSPKEIQDVLINFLNDHWYKQIPLVEPNYILHSYAARSGSKTPLPLHIDSFIPYAGSHPLAIQVGVSLERQDQRNGCTVIVPKSHKSARYARQEDRKAAIPIESQPGDVVIWDSRIWHGSGANESSGTRWSLIATFVRWWVKQGFNITQSLPQHIYEKLTPSQKCVLGFCSIPPDSESERINTKAGYDSLEESVSSYLR